MKFLNYELGDWQKYSCNYYRKSIANVNDKENIFIYVGLRCKNSLAGKGNLEYRFDCWSGNWTNGFDKGHLTNYDIISVYNETFSGADIYVRLDESNLQEAKDKIDKFLVKLNNIKAFFINLGI